MSVLGFDPSLVSSGYCYQHGDAIKIGTIVPHKKLDKVHRLQVIKNEFSQILTYSMPELVAYEGYAMGAKGRVFSIGELGGVLKSHMWEARINMLIVPPSTLKQYITGKGNATKEEMSLALQERFNYSITQDDECDATCLYLFGEAYLHNSNSVKEYRNKCEFISVTN